MRSLPLLALLAACSAGPNEETLVDELRVIAAVAEPPEVLPGESTAVSVVVADPLLTGAKVAVWMCTPAEEGCAEAGSELSDRLAVGQVENGTFVADLTINPLWAAFANPEPIPAPVWVLACEPGLCTQLDAFEDALANGASEQTETLLATPTEWVADLPIVGVSLGAKSLMVSTRAPGERNTNPTMLVDAPATSAPGEELAIEVQVDDDDDIPEVMGLSTAGGFGGTGFPILDGLAVMRWYAPEEPGEVALYAVATDGVGGTAVWTGTAMVE
ncbi:MAG: hypothetical protein EP330_18975 [Deltaproteobacteria bacterium]|nr:MAG: hypothetical protein EP330_18975 [Deltaproteobacteria bacterium]